MNTAVFINVCPHHPRCVMDFQVKRTFTVLNKLRMSRGEGMRFMGGGRGYTPFLMYFIHIPDRWYFHSISALSRTLSKEFDIMAINMFNMTTTAHKWKMIEIAWPITGVMPWERKYCLCRQEVILWFLVEGSDMTESWEAWGIDFERALVHVTWRSCWNLATSTFLLICRGLAPRSHERETSIKK